jgi:hypothetical protein
MTQSEIAARILTNLNENAIFFTPDDLNFSVQDGYDEIAAATGLIEKATTLTLSASTTYYDFRTLIPDFIGLIGIWNTVTKRYLTPVSLMYLERQRPDWEVQLGTPEIFWVVNFRYVAIFPQRADPCYVFYRASAPTLASGTSILIPEEHLRVLMDYSTSDLLETQQEFESSMGYLENYIAGIEKLRQAVQNGLNKGRAGGLR